MKKQTQKKESVWDYPRPPRAEATSKRIRVIFGGVTIADSQKTLRVLETSHPPVYYIPPEDIKNDHLQPSTKRTHCEFKGTARYWHVRVGEKEIRNAAWSYPSPAKGYESLRDHVAFYPGFMDACYVDKEQVTAQGGDFYGGWITPDISGPFKGGPGTRGW
jgi:uncharacterized protein (DUF427 family)